VSKIESKDIKNSKIPKIPKEGKKNGKNLASNYLNRIKSFNIYCHTNPSEVKP